MLHLAAAQVDAIVPQLLSGGYRAETPCAVGVRELAAADDSAVHACLADEMRAADITKTAVIVVGDVLAAGGSRTTCTRLTGCDEAGTRGAGRTPALMRVLRWAARRPRAGRRWPGVDLISSLAGRVPDRIPVGAVRIGGSAASRDAQWPATPEYAVVDATHPYAPPSPHAAEVCGDLGNPASRAGAAAWNRRCVGKSDVGREAIEERIIRGCS